MGTVGRFGLAALLASSALGQPVFEAVSWKWHATGGPSGAIRVRPDGVAGDNVPLRQWIRFAFDLQDIQIVGPGWMAEEGLDLDAKASGRLSPAELRLAIQTVLADRLALRLHRENRELPGYRLRVAATGAKLRDPKEEESFHAALAGKPPFKEGFAGIFTNKDLPGFAERLSRGIGRIVLDETGIKERYWFQLEWVPDEGQPGADGPSLRTAIEEQLGLNLVEAKVLAEVLVVRSVKRRP